jgi:hypothetical protein
LQFCFPSTTPSELQLCQMSSKSFTDDRFNTLRHQNSGVMERKDYCYATEF